MILKKILSRFGMIKSSALHALDLLTTLKRFFTNLILILQNATLSILFLYFSQAKIDKRDRILIIRSKYRPGSKEKSERELSTEYYNLSLTLKESILTEFDEYFYDVDYRGRSFPFGDIQLFRKCAMRGYKAIVLSSYSPSKAGLPKKVTFDNLSTSLDIPIFFISWDSVGSASDVRLKSIANFTYCNVFVDLKQKNSKSLKKSLDLGFTPLPECLFYRGNEIRDIDVSFLGSTSAYRTNRKKYLNVIDTLEKKGYRCVIGGGTSANSRMKMSDYAEIYRRSKVVINFSESVNGAHHIKGRVFEAIASGALLLESDNEETAKMFCRHLDYVPFFDPEDLLKKLEFYLSNPSERDKVASKAFSKYQSNYTGFIFWKVILDEVEGYVTRSNADMEEESL